MATVFQNDTLFEGNNIIEKQFQALGDTDQGSLIAINISELAGPDSNGTAPSTWPAPSKLSLMEITWDVQGFNFVQLLWDATTADEITYMGGQGYMSFWPIGGKHDPQSTGFTGDVMLISGGAASADDSYSIRAVFKKKK